MVDFRHKDANVKNLYKYLKLYKIYEYKYIIKVYIKFYLSFVSCSAAPIMNLVGRKIDSIQAELKLHSSPSAGKNLVRRGERVQKISP